MQGSRGLRWMWWLAFVLCSLCTCAAIYLLLFGHSTSGRVTAVVGVTVAWLTLFIASRVARRSQG